MVLLISGVIIQYQTLGLRTFTSESKRRLMISEQPVKLVHAELQTNNNRLISWDEFKGKYIIADFIYTRCDSVCNRLGHEFAQLQIRLDDLIKKEKLLLLSISFDAEYDVPSKLDDYVKFHGGGEGAWIAARIRDKSSEINVLQQFGVVAIPDEFGEFIHNAAFHIISPDGKLMEIVDYENASDLVAIIRSDVLE